MIVTVGDTNYCTVFMPISCSLCTFFSCAHSLPVQCLCSSQKGSVTYSLFNMMGEYQTGVGPFRR